MATEADIPEPASLLEKGVNRYLTTGEFNQTPETADYFVKSGNMEVASNVETLDSGFKGNAGMTVGESFSESSSITKVPGEETSRKQETCQADDMPHQAEKEMEENEKQILEHENSKTAEETGSKENEHVGETEEISKKGSNEISDSTGIHLKREKVGEQCLKVGEEETSREEKMSDHIKAYSIKENPKIIEKKTSGLQNDEEDKDAELTTGKDAMILEASSGQNRAASIHNPEQTVHNLDTNVETSTNACLKIENKDKVSSTEISSVDENNEQKNSGGVEEKEANSCSSFLDEEKGPDVANTIEKIESEKGGIRGDANEQASTILAASIDIQNDREANSAITENVENKLDNPSVSSMQEAGLKVGGDKLEDTSIIASKEESQDTINLNENMEEVTLFLNETQKNHADIPSVTQTEEMCWQKVDKTEISKAVIGTWSEDVVDRSPQESSHVEILEKTAQADSREGEKVKDEMTPEQKLDSLKVRHEEGKQNVAEEPATTEASAGKSKDNDGHTIVASEHIINDAVTAAEHSKGELGNEKIKTSLEMASEETSATASSDCSETITCAKDDRSTENNEECFHKKEKEEKSIAIDISSDDAIPREENLPPTEPTEKIEIEEVEIPNKNVDELNATHSLEQGTVLVKGAELQEFSGFEPPDQGAEKEKSVDIDAIKDDGIALEENLLSTELNEKIQIEKIEAQNKNGDELNVTHSLKPETTLLQHEELPEVSFFEPKNQVNEAEKLVGTDAIEDDGIPKNLQPTESIEKIEISEVKIPNKCVDELNATHTLEQETVLAQGEVLGEVSNFEPQNQVNEEEKSIDIDAIKDEGISNEKNLPPTEPNEKNETVKVERNKEVDNLNATHSFEREAEIVQQEELEEIFNLEPQSQINEEEKLIDSDAIKDDGIQKVESLPPTEPSEKIQISEVQFPNKNVDELNMTHSSEQETVLAQGEVLQEVSDLESQEQVNEEEESVNIDAVKDDGIPRNENLPPAEPIGTGEIEIEDNNVDALNATPPLEQDTKLVQGEELQEVSKLEPQNQVKEEEKLNLPQIEPSENIHISEVEIPNKNVDELNAIHSLEQETVLAQDEVLQEVPDFEPEEQVNEEEKLQDIDVIKDDGIPKDENLSPAALNKKIGAAKAEIQDKSIDELNATPSLEQETELVQGDELREVSNLEPQDQIKEEEKLVNSNSIKDDEIPRVENQPPKEPSENIHISEVEIPNKNADESNVTPWEQETEQTQGEVSREVSDFEPQGQVKEEEKSLNIYAIKDDEIPKEENLSPAEPNEKIGIVEVEIQDKDVDELNATPSLKQDEKLVQGEELPEVSNLEPQDQVYEEEKLNLPPIEPNENIHISEVEVPNKNLDELNETNSLEQETVLAQGEVLQEVSDFEPQDQVQEEEKSLDIDAIKDDGIPKENLSPAEPNEKLKKMETEIQGKNVYELNATPLLEQDPKLVQGEDLREVSNLEPQDQVKEEEKSVESDAINEDGIPKVENLPPTEPSENIHVPEVDIPNKNVDELNATHSWEQESVKAQGEVSQELSDFEPQGQVKEEDKSLNTDVVKDYEIPKEENLSLLDELNATPSLEGYSKLVQVDELQEVSDLEPQDQVNEEEKLAGIDAIKDNGIPKIENLTPTKPSEKAEIAEVETPNKNIDELNIIHTLEQEMKLAQVEVLQEVSDFEPQEQVNEEEISVDIDAVKDDGTPKEENLPPADLNEKIKAAQVEIQNKNIDESNVHSLKQEAALMQGEELQEVSNREPQDQVNEEEKSVDTDIVKDKRIPKVENLSPAEPSEKIEIAEVEIPNNYADESHVTHPLELKMVLAQGEALQEVSEFEAQEQVNEEKSIEVDVVKEDGIPKEENIQPTSLNEMIEIEKVEIQKNVDELTVAHSVKQETILVQGEKLQEVSNSEPQGQVNEEEKSEDIDTIKDDGIPKVKNLPSIELNDKIEVAEVEIPNKNVDQLNVSHLLEQGPVLTQVEVLQEVFDFEPQDQVNEANAATRDGEKLDENNSQACESTKNNSELPLAKREVITELSLETSENEIEKLEKVHKSGSEAKFEIKEVDMSRQEDIQKEEACETGMHKLETSDGTEKTDTEEAASDKVCSEAFLHETAEQNFGAASLQKEETPLKDGEGDEKITSIVNEKATSIGEVSDEQNIKDRVEYLSTEVINEETTESSEQIEKEVEIYKGEDTRGPIIGGNGNESISQKTVEKGLVKNFQDDEKNIDTSNSREITTGTVNSITNEAKQNDEKPNSILQLSLAKEQENLQSETSLAEEFYGDESPVKKDEYKENYTGLAEVEEHNEEISTGEKNLEQICQKNEAVENIEQPLNLISAEIDGSASRETDDKTVEERVESPKDNEREAEMAKEEIIQETNIKSLSQESIAQDSVKNNQNDDNSAKKSNTQIFEESKAAGTDESIEQETDQNDTSETIPKSLVKEVESLENEGKNIVVQASLEEKMEDGSSVKVVEDNTRLKEDNKDSDMEESKIADSFSPEMSQTDESLSSALQASLVREQECLQSVTQTPPETSPMDEKDENGSIKSDEENKEQSEEEKLKSEGDLEQILQKTEPGENLEQPITVLSAKTEAGALSEVAKNLEEETVDIHPNNAKKPEIPKEEEGAKEHIIYEQGIVKNFRNDEINFEICNKEICMESMTNKTCQSIPIETSQNNESQGAPHPTAPMQDEENLQGKGKDMNPAEALPEEKKEDNGSAVKANKDDDKNTELSEVINNSEKDTSKGGENTELELQNNEPEELEKSTNMINAETEAGMLCEKANDIIIVKQVEAIQNAGETAEKQKNEEGNEDIESEAKKVPTTEDLKPDAETSDINIGVESELLEAKLITSEREAEIIEKTNGLDSIEKLEGKHTNENTEEEIKKEDIEEVCSDIATACLSEATKKDTTVEALTTTDISPQSTGEETALIYREDKEEKPNMEMQELDLISIVEETEKQVPEEVNILRDQSTESAIVIADDITVIMPQKEMHEIIQSAKKDEDVGKQITEEGSSIEENSEVHVRGINEEDPLQKQKEDESDTINLKEEIKGFDSESTDQIAASSYEVVKEDNRQLESFGPETHDKEPVTGHMKETTLDSVDIGAPRDDAPNLVGKRYHEISAEADKAEEDVNHELQNEALITGSNDQNKVIISETASGKILDVNLMECAKMTSKDSELITNEESQPIDESSAEHPTSNRNIKIAQFSQATDPMHDEDKITIKEGVSELDYVIIGIESGSYQREDLHQDLELHNEQIISKTEDAKVLKTEETRDLVDQGATCKSKISEDEEPSNKGDEYFKCIETINADRKEAIQEEEDSAQKPEASLEKDDAVEKEAAELEAGYQKQGLEDSETKNNGIHKEQNFESAESSKKLASETLTRDQSNETIHETNPKPVEENRIAESVEQRSQESQENQQEMEEKTEPKLEVGDKLEETQNADETIRAVILTEKVCKEVGKHDDDEIVKRFNKEENDIKVLHTVCTEDGGVDEVKESCPVSTEYLKATDSNEETEIESSEVQAAQTLEKEISTAKENEERKVKDEDSEKIAGLSAIVPTNESEEIVNEEAIKDADSCYNKIKTATVTEITAQPSLEAILRDDKQEQDSNTPSDKSSPHAEKPEASQQGSIALEEKTFAYESRGYGMEDLQTGEVREKIREDSEIVNRSRADETVSGTEVARDQTLPEEIAKEHEAPSLSMPCKEEDYGTEATIDNVEESMEKMIITKGETVENSSALKTAEDICLQKENSRELEVSQLGLQVRESMPDSSNEKHKENKKEVELLEEETLDETEEVKKAAETASKSAAEHKVADDQTVPEEKSEEQHQTESVALLFEEHELGSTMAENIKEVELLEDEPKTNEEVCLQKETSEEFKVFQLDLEQNKDTEASPKEAPKVASATSVEVDEKKEAFECKSVSISEDNGVAKEDGTSSVQTNPVEKSEEQNSLLSSALLSKEHEVGMSAKIRSIEENKKEMEVLEEVFLQNEDSRELEVSLVEFQIDKDAQNEIHKRGDGDIDGTEEEIKEVSELAVKSSSQVYKAVAEDEITSNRPLPTEKSEEENQISLVVLLSKDQEDDTSTTAESIKENKINVEVPENAPKTVEEEASMQKGESREFNSSQLELQLDTDIQESPEEVRHEAEDGTLDEPLKSQHQNDHEMGDAECAQEKGKISEITGSFEKISNLKTDTNEEAAESMSEVHGHEVLVETEETGIKEEHLEVATMALMAKENQCEKTTNATENMHDEVMNEQIMEEKDDAKNFRKIIHGEESTKESHREHEILAKEIQNEAISTGKGTVENLYQAVVDNISSKEATKEIHQEHEIKSEESVGDKVSVKEIQIEAVCKEMENASGSETIEKQISMEKGTFESLHQSIGDNITCEEATKEIHQGHEIKDEEILGDKMLAREIQPEEKCKEIENADASEIITKQISIEKGTVESLHQDVVDKISSEKVTKEIHQDHEIKDEEILGDKILAKEIQPEELYKEIENADASETIAKRISTEKETVESPHRDVFYNISSEQATQEIYQEHEKKDEEILGDKELVRELQTEELCKEIENTDGSVTTAKRMSPGKETDENLYQVVENETTTEHFPDETGGEILDKAGARINIKDQGDETISGDSGTEATIATEKDLVVETSQKERAGHPEETTLGIHQEEKTFDGTLENQISREVEPEKMISTSKKDAPQVQQEPNGGTTQVTETEGSQPAYASVVTPEVKRLEHGAENIVDEKDGKAIQDTTSKDSAKISLFDMMQRSTRERQVARELTEEKGPIASKEEMKVEKQTEKQTEKAKSDEEVEEEEEGYEQNKNDSGSDALVIVEASRDIDIKVGHKKSHNILSGVGSKVKHSISKVKKAITGKSSHPKQHSPK